MVVRMPCHVCMVTGQQQMKPTVPAHIKTRGGGGKAEHVPPLSIDHENEWHAAGGDTFDAKYSVRMRRVAFRRWRARSEERLVGKEGVHRGKIRWARLT